MLKRNWEEKTRASNTTVLLSAEYMEIIIREATERAAKIAKEENSQTIEAVHMEKVIPQLLLDI